MMLCVRITSRSFFHIHKTLRQFKFTTLKECNRKDPNFPALLSLKQRNAYTTVSQRFYCATSAEPKESSQEQIKEEKDAIRDIYTFPKIKQASLITKLKLFQTVVVCGLAPWVYAAYLAGAVSYMSMLSSVFIMGTSTVSLYLIGDIITRIVCRMKYNDVTGEIYISHINFWGRRRNVAVHASNFIPISDSKEKLTDTYVKLDTYDKSESFLVFFKDCTEEQKSEILKLVG